MMNSEFLNSLVAFSIEDLFQNKNGGLLLLRNHSSASLSQNSALKFIGPYKVQSDSFVDVFGDVGSLTFPGLLDEILTACSRKWRGM